MRPGSDCDRGAPSNEAIAPNSVERLDCCDPLWPDGIGVLSNYDLAQQQATVAAQQARLPGLIESEREARYALAILLGRAPEGFDVPPDGKEIWAAHSRDGGVSIINLFSKTVTHTFSVQTHTQTNLNVLAYDSAGSSPIDPTTLTITVLRHHSPVLAGVATLTRQ